MGIILTDVYTLSSNIQLSNVYISFFNEQLFLQPQVLQDNTKGFMASSNYRLYKDKTAREEVRDVVEKAPIMSTTDTLSNAYTNLYAALKQKFPNSEDDI